MHGCTIHRRKVNKCELKKKKNQRKTRILEKHGRGMLNPNGYLVYVWIGLMHLAFLLFIFYFLLAPLAHEQSTKTNEQ